MHSLITPSTMQLITPSYLATINSDPSIIGFSKKYIIFNAIATRRLALKKGDQFVIGYNNAAFYLKFTPSTTDSFVVSEINPRGAAVAAGRGIGTFWQRHFKIALRQFRFEVGPLADGVYKITHIEPPQPPAPAEPTPTPRRKPGPKPKTP